MKPRYSDFNCLYKHSGQIICNFKHNFMTLQKLNNSANNDGKEHNF